MGTGLDHVFIVHFDELMCDMCEYIYMVDVFGTLGLKNINLGVRGKKKTEHDSSGICTTSWTRKEISI